MDVVVKCVCGFFNSFCACHMMYNEKVVVILDNFEVVKMWDIMGRKVSQMNFFSAIKLSLSGVYD